MLAPFSHSFFNDWSEQERLWKDFDRRIQNYLPRMSELTKSSFDFSPLVDVSENEKNILIHADLPGVAKENIQVDLEQGNLVIKGMREERTEEKDTKWHRLESHRGSFLRTIALPKGVQPKGISAVHKDGVLEITIEKPDVLPPERVHKIQIE